MSSIPQQRVHLTETRKRRGWSQKELAKLLGTTQVNVSRWERGLTTPTPYFRAKLSALFGKSAEELGFVPGSSPMAAIGAGTEANLSVEVVPVSHSPMYWQVPLRRNSFFTGRSAILTCIHDYLAPQREDVHARALALCGLGGIGKTQIVLEYAYHYAQDYTAVFWITAETSEGILTGFTSIATQLLLLEAASSDQYTIVAAVLSWFTTHRDWLLIVDNVEEVALIKPFLPAARYGAFLFTTRLQAVGILAYPLQLEQMTREEGAKLLLSRAGRMAPEAPLEQASPLDITLACSMTEALSGFPLAIDQAGAYIEEVQCSLAEYFRLYQSSPYFLLNQRDTSSDHPASVVRTFLLAFEHVQRRSPVAVDFLRLCAFLHADSIPEEVFSLGPEKVGSLLASLASDQGALDHIVKTLRHFSLVDRNPEAKTVTLHRLVQVVIQESMNEELQRLWAMRAVQAITHLLPDGDPWAPSAHVRWQRCFSHALVCAALIEKWHLFDATAIRLLSQTGMYLMECAMYLEGETIYRHMLEVCKDVLGPDHSQTGETLNDLALLLWCQGRYQEAEPYYLQALTSCERAFGPAHPAVLHIRHNLAVLYQDQGKYTRAEQLFQEAASTRERILGPMHPSVAESLQGLALTYISQQRFNEAEGLSLQALSIRRQILGEDHPSIAQSLTHLGKLYAARGESSQGQAFLWQAITIREKKLGAVHPRLAICLNALGDIYLAQGQYEQAEPLLKRAWSIREQMLPPQHPHRAESLYSLAQLFIVQGAFEQAELLVQQAREIVEHAFGPRHPFIKEVAR